MRVLEARFHELGHSDEFVVVGRVVCHEGYASVHPDVAFVQTPGSRTLSDLLRGLDSVFWTFVECDRDVEAAASGQSLTLELK